MGGQCDSSKQEYQASTHTRIHKSIYILSLIPHIFLLYAKINHSFTTFFSLFQNKLLIYNIFPPFQIKSLIYDLFSPHSRAGQPLTPSSSLHYPSHFILF